MKLKHAKHNETACKYLKDNGSFNDWVITTAFYSAIHYVDCELFPKQYLDPRSGNPKNFSDFESYYNNTDKTINKHKVRQNLVEEHIPELADDFQTLKENCWNARYSSYTFSVEVSDLCFKSMQNIKEICEPV